MPLSLVSGCKAKPKPKPKSKQTAKQGSRVRDSFEYAMVPDVGPVPAGVDETLWADVAYLPKDIVALGLLPRQYSLLAWVDSEIHRFDPSCQEVLDGIERYYMVQLDPDPQVPQALVFYGKIDRLVAERCAKSMFRTLGVGEYWEVEHDGTSTVFGAEQVVHALEWAKRGDEIVVAYDPDPALIEGLFEGRGRLEHDASFVDLLVGVTPDDSFAENVGREDFGTLLTGVESSGYRGTFGFDPKHGLLGQVWLRYDSAEQAKQASAGLDGLIEEFSAVGVGILVSDGVDGQRLSFHIEPDWSFFAEPEAKLRPLLEIIARRAKAAGEDEPDVEALMSLALQAGGGAGPAPARDVESAG